MQIKRKFYLITLLLTIIMLSSSTMAHPGRTDANGGHYNRKTGEYHYHNGGHSSGSSGSSSSSSSYGSSRYKSSGGGSSASQTPEPAPKPTPVYASRIDATDVPTEINAGQTYQLKGSVYPSNAEDKDITWGSDNSAIVNVSPTGYMEAKGVGKANIIAKTSRGTESKFAINVKEIVASSISIKEKPKEILVDNTVMLSANLTPENSTNKTIQWKSENEKIAKVSSEGELVGVGVGKTKISAIHKNLVDSFEIQVKPVEVKSIVLDFVSEDTSDSSENEDTSKLRVCKDKTIQFIATVLPDNATNQDIKWSVDNESIATIDESGLLTGIEKGSVIVTATANNGIKETIEVEVYTNTTSNVIVGTLSLAAIAGIVYFVTKKKKDTKEENLDI